MTPEYTEDMTRSEAWHRGNEQIELFNINVKIKSE